jgi:hypothetical protein
MSRVDFELETGPGGREGTPAKTDGDVCYHLCKPLKVYVSLKPAKKKKGI